MYAKGIILIILVLAALAVWIIPRTSFAARLTFSERTYRTIHWIGAICAVAGIVLTFLLQSALLEEHVYEFILLPVLFAYAVYPAIVARSRNTTELLDEKQLWDTTQAAAFSLTGTVLLMSLVFAFYGEGVLSGTVWYPILMYGAVGWYSAATLYLHRTG